MQQQIIDISVPVSTKSVVWPDDPPFAVRRLAEFADDAVRVSEVTMSVHTGTHVDAPAHYVEKGTTIDKMALEAMMGPCVVHDLSDAGQQITADELVGLDLRPGERVLLRTQNSSRHLWSQKGFARDFAYITPDAAAHLAARQVRCLGIDYLSVGGLTDGEETHRVLLGAGIWILEGLDLRGVKPGEYELVCLPLRLEGLEAAPARAVLRPLPRGGADFVDDAVEYASMTG